MAELLKNVYNKEFIEKIGLDLSKVDVDFSTHDFIDNTFNEELLGAELKERMRIISTSIGKFLKGSYPKQVNALSKIVSNYSGLEGLIFPDFIEVYGQEDYKTSIAALEYFTQYSSAEFAIRPFIRKYPETMKVMKKWSKHENYHVRRLASEGCRPLLPWGGKLREFIKDPSPILPILENLKNDPEDYVYRSVANNLNDISKNQPDLSISIAKGWLKEGKNAKWAAKHAMRTLLKKGYPEVMTMFGFGNGESLKTETFSIKKTSINIGDNTGLEIRVKNIGKKAKFRLEYAIYYLKKNGSNTEKVFQITEKELDKNEVFAVTKKLGFKDLTTRKHYAGEHFIALIVNGMRGDKVSFKLR